MKLWKDHNGKTYEVLGIGVHDQDGSAVVVFWPAENPGEIRVCEGSEFLKSFTPLSPPTLRKYVPDSLALMVALKNENFQTQENRQSL